MLDHTAPSGLGFAEDFHFLMQGERGIFGIFKIYRYALNDKTEVVSVVTAEKRFDIE